MSSNSKDAILAAARLVAQARGYGGLNFRDLADVVGIKAASIYYHFPSKADLGAAVAKRYREDNAAALQALAVETGDPAVCLKRYPDTFRTALANDNRMCLASFMAAEYDELPRPIRTEIQAFSDAMSHGSPTVSLQQSWWTQVRLKHAGAPSSQQSQARSLWRGAALTYSCSTILSRITKKWACCPSSRRSPH